MTTIQESLLKTDGRKLRPKAVIGMIHVGALPGSVGWRGNMGELINQVLDELAIYRKYEVDAIMLENMHDVPYAKPPLADETKQAMLAVANQVRAYTSLPIGIQMLEAANCEAMEIAALADLDFIRAEGYVYAHIGGAGLIESSARQILQVRQNYNAPHIQVFADVKKKHCAHALTSDLSVKDVVRQSDFFCADGMIVTGSFTGEPVNIEDLRQTRAATQKPIIIGSGITAVNLPEYFRHADAFIVGSHFKHEGDWRRPVDASRVARLMMVRNHLLDKLTD